LSTLTADVAERIGCIIFEPEHELYSVDELTKRLQEFGFRSNYFGSLVVCNRVAS
jgi:hypothetical protein